MIPLRLFKAIAILFSLIVLSVLPASGQIPQHLDSFSLSPLKKGEFLLLSRQSGEALKVFQELWRSEPDNDYAVRGIVRAHQAAKALSEAVPLFKKYLKEHPASSSAQYGLGYVYYLQKNDKAAETELRAALKRNPAHALALNTLGAVLIRLNHPEEAIRRIKEAIEIQPNELMFYRNLGRVYFENNQKEKFIEEFNEYLNSGKQDRAQAYGKVHAQKLRQESFQLYVEGDINGTISKISDMLEVYRRISHKPGIVAGLFSLAILYEEQEFPGKAMDMYREVLKINPQHIQAREKLKILENKFPAGSEIGK